MVRIAPREATILLRSIASAALLSFILVKKLVDHLPFYQQAKRFAQNRIDIDRQDMSNRTITVERAIKPHEQTLRTATCGLLPADHPGRR